MRIILSKNRIFELTQEDINEIRGKMICDASISRHLVISHDKANYADRLLNILETDKKMSDEIRDKYHLAILYLLNPGPVKEEDKVPQLMEMGTFK